MYETGAAAQVRAFHVMPAMPPPEGELHSHDYRLEAVAKREELDDRGMVVDLDVLGGALEDAVSEVEDANLDKLLPGQAAGVTVELFARWLHDRLAEALGPLPGVTLAVRVWESPLAFGGYRRAL
jgi:6-pyruvoyltetrahydropterin/6-carboxytetrahydropterin synthase